MNIIFSIVAKNYLALAKTLMSSIGKNHSLADSSTALYVIVADELREEEKFEIPNCTIIEAKTLGIDNYYSLAYKYDVTEFCTALKPFGMDYFASMSGVENIIYFDPDIYVFSSLDEIFSSLYQRLCVLTPHYITPQSSYSGVVPEEMILWVGIFNLGFIAVNCLHEKYHLFINWWKDRLYHKCYADKLDGLHTDQKWIDYLPSFFPNDIYISHHIGCNVSIWNLHERFLVNTQDGVEVQNMFSKENFPLIFFHFSGFDIKNKDGIHKHHPALTIKERPEMREFMDFYRKQLIENDIFETLPWSYSYSKYKNGNPISFFHRRLFRRLLDTGERFNDPFSVREGSFYSILKNNRLITTENSADRTKAADIEKYSGKISLMLHLFRIARFLIGIDRYALLMKFLFRYSRPENQVFLMKEYKDRFQFYNENRIESTNK